MISLAFGIDESELGAEALLLARGEMSATGLRQMGITAHVLILPGAAIDA